MPKMLIGKKLAMSQIFTEDGKLIPVTVIQAGPCVVSQVKTTATDGYEAVQIGFGALKHGTKPQVGHFAKTGVTPLRYLREMRVADAADYQPGQELKVDIFAAGEKIDVEGTSKGKGFAGTIKRWNHHLGPMSHGSKNHRRPSSAGAKGPARTFKGKHSPGQMGSARVTVQNLEIVRVDVERNLLLVKGAVPGPKKGLVYVKSAVKSAQ
ncbi:MAG: 50S ribosomal protein L3 [Firmicutes bacterium]|nr:50S ribosomal protein L3 [Bacillota bacterium]